MPARAARIEEEPVPMKKAMKLTSAALTLAAAAAFCAGWVRQAHAQATTPIVAVAEIHYVDTSGEVIDQSADHRRRLREFEASLRNDLAASGKMANVALECPPNACSVGDIGDGQLLGKAEQAGATHLLIGRFHKMSTLVQQAKFDVIDVKARKLVFDRYITFRGDNDAAWHRAESFLARQILDHGKW